MFKRLEGFLVFSYHIPDNMSKKVTLFLKDFWNIHKPQFIVNQSWFYENEIA